MGLWSTARTSFTVNRSSLAAHKIPLLLQHLMAKTGFGKNIDNPT
jgi:hypothetical protein